jgi:hypothetical protein
MPIHILKFKTLRTLNTASILKWDFFDETMWNEFAYEKVQ